MERVGGSTGPAEKNDLPRITGNGMAAPCKEEAVYLFFEKRKPSGLQCDEGRVFLGSGQCLKKRSSYNHLEL
jgi:hypothetical protein